MKTAEQNYLLLQEIEMNRRFLLSVYQQNPQLLERAEMRIRQMFEVSVPYEVEGVKAVAGAAKQRGISLIELIMFIVIVSVALAGILLVMNVTTKGSADPLIHKQALAIAESLLEEVELMPFTFCDPNDANAANATAATAAECPAAGGVGGIEGLGAETDANGTETRYSAAIPFDNVNDYYNFGMAAGAILDITGTNTGLNGYTLQPIVVAPVALPNVAAPNDALLITVTVIGPDNVSVVVEGIRTRYSPRAVP